MLSQTSRTVARLGEAVGIEHPGREGREGADAPSGDDDQRLAAQRRAGDQPQRQRAGEVDHEDADREGVLGAGAELGVDQEARHGGATAEHRDCEPARRAHASAASRRPSPVRCSRVVPRRMADVAAGQGRGEVAGGQAEVAGIDHFEQLQLHRGERGQRPADARRQERVRDAVVRMVAQPGDEVAEQERADHVDGKCRPGPAVRTVRSELREPDPGQRPDHPAQVDRRQAARVESHGFHPPG